MALQDYVNGDKDHRNEGKSIRDSYMRNENKDHEQVNNRDIVNDLMSVRTEDRSRKRQYRRLLRILAIILFLGVFICLSIFFFLYDFDKGASDDVIFVGKSNIATVPGNTIDSTAASDDVDSIIPITAKKITPAPAKSVAPASAAKNVTPAPVKKVTPAPAKSVTPAPAAKNITTAPAKEEPPAYANNVTPVAAKNSNVKKDTQPTNQQMYFYDNLSQYDYLAQYDNYSQYGGMSQYDNSFQNKDISRYDKQYQYEDVFRYDNRFQYEDLPRYDNRFQYEDLFQSKNKYQVDKYQYKEYNSENWNRRQYNETGGSYFSYNEPQVSFPESFRQREESTDNSGKKSYPVIGEKAYNEYLEKNLRKLPDNACGGNFGKIILLFKVNANGRPYDIAILRSLCQSVDEEAIRLLQEGSNWTVCDNYARLEIYF